MPLGPAVSHRQHDAEIGADDLVFRVDPEEGPTVAAVPKGARRSERPGGDRPLVPEHIPAKAPGSFREALTDEVGADARDLIARHRSHARRAEEVRIAVPAAVEEHLSEGCHI